MRQEAWRRFFVNAARVKKLDLNTYTSINEHLRAVCRRQISSFSPLFPNLRHLVCGDIPDRISMFLPMLIGPHMESCGVIGRMSEDVLQALLGQLLHTATEMRFLHLRRPMHVDTELILPRFKSLTTLWSTQKISVEGVNRLSQLPTLHTLSCSLVSLNRNGGQQLAPDTFTALSSLDIRIKIQDMDMASELLRLCKFPVLKRLTINLLGRDEIKSKMLGKLLAAISAHKTLLFLQLSGSNYVPDPLLVFTGRALPITPLLQLHLEVFSTGIPGIAVGDDDIVSLGQAWPCLRAFDMRHSKGPNTRLGQTNFTLHSLELFATHLPHLTSLAIDIDIDDIERDNLEFPRQRNTKRISLGLEHNPLPADKWLPVAAYISSVYPEADIGDGLLNEFFDPSPEDYSACEAWLNVRDSFHLLSEIRRHERMLVGGR